MDSDRKLSYVADEISKKMKKEINKPTQLTEFLSIFGLKVPSLVNKVINYSKTYDKLAADAVKNVFKGKGFIEGIGLINPTDFASNLSDKTKTKEEIIKDGADMYKKYILNN